MNRAISILCFVLSFILTAIPSLAQPPETLWTRTFNNGGNALDWGYDVQQTTDGGFIVSGFGYREESNNDVWVIKTDSDGNEVWNQFFGGIASDLGYGIEQTTDGGFAVLANTYSYGAGYLDVWLIKIDADGNEVWTQTYGELNADRGESMQQTSDGGFIIVGYTNSIGAGYYDIMLIKTDEFGNQLWMRTYGFELHDNGYSVQQTSDGGYIIAGSTGSIGAGASDGFLIKTDYEGEVEWERTVGGTSSDALYDVRQTTDGGYIMVGETASFGIGPKKDLWMIKMDAEGNELWWRNHGGVWNDVGNSVRQTDDGGYIMAGTWERSLLDPDMWLLKTDELGNHLWSQLFTGEDPIDNYNDDEGYSVRQTSDGGYIATGIVEQQQTGNDIALIRIAADVTPGMTVSITLVDPPSVIPAEGGVFQYYALVMNPSDFHYAFSGWVEVDIPDGTTHGPILFRQGLSLTPGGQFEVILTQEVPGFAPAGVYVYRGAIGYYPYSVFDSSEFEFEKLPSNGQTSVNNWNTGLSK
jgi:hypothetical protein